MPRFAELRLPLTCAASLACAECNAQIQWHVRALDRAVASSDQPAVTRFRDGLARAQHEEERLQTGGSPCPAQRAAPAIEAAPAPAHCLLGPTECALARRKAPRPEAGARASGGAGSGGGATRGGTLLWHAVAREDGRHGGDQREQLVERSPQTGAPPDGHAPAGQSPRTAFAQATLPPLRRRRWTSSPLSAAQASDRWRRFATLTGSHGW